MRGISPKQEVPRDQWAIHLANKIKFHWRPLLSACRGGWGTLLLLHMLAGHLLEGLPCWLTARGCSCRSGLRMRTCSVWHGGPRTRPCSLPIPAGGLHCPFKPDKYFESYTYARLPAPDRWAERLQPAVLGCSTPGLPNGSGVC